MSGASPLSVNCNCTPAGSPKAEGCGTDRIQLRHTARDGGFATHAVADACYAFELDPDADPVSLAMPYRLWREREVVSVANLTRRDAEEFFPVARQAGVQTHTTAYPLVEANKAIDDLRAGNLSGANGLVS